MKRKLFSAILFGALLTASTSGLTSCKDYDDDISNLQGQIDKLAAADQLFAKVSDMQAAISAAQSAAESKAAAAQTVADAAKAAAADAAAAASKAQGAADDAAKAAAAAAEVGKAAQAAVDKLAAEAATKADLEAAAQAAQAAVEAIKAEHATDKAEIEAAIETGLNSVKDEIAATNEKLAALAARLDTVEEKLAALEAGEGQEEVLAAIQAEVEDIADVLESLGITISEMITAVHLYPGIDGFNNSLQFWQVKEAVDRVFPTDIDDVEDVTDETIKFEKGTVRALEDSVLVRVSPANAVLHAEDIALLNTQGKEFDASLFEEIKVSEYTRSAPLTKAAGNLNTGLWVVKFKLNKDFDADKFAENALYKKAQIAFALAVKNCDENLAEDRRVVTEYDVTAAAPLASHATTFYLTPDGEATKDVTAIHHRFDNYTNKLAGTFPTALKGNDYRWDKYYTSEDDIKAGKANLEFITDGSKPTAVKETSRQDKPVLTVKEKQDIVIEFNTDIKGFYVTLDYKRAGESGRSEINAWNSYSYENVAKIDEDGKIYKGVNAKMQYGKKGYIKVNSLEQNSTLGDVIGFRVWAVNLDGSMVDPDGTAFYVGIGANAEYEEPVVSGSALVTVATPTATQTNGVVLDVADAFNIDFNKIVWTNVTANNDEADGTSREAKEGKGYTPYAGTFAPKTGETHDIKLTYLDKDGKEISSPKYALGNNTNGTVTPDAGDFTQVKKILVQINKPGKVVDNATYDIVGEMIAKLGNTEQTVRKVHLKVTKELPGDSNPVYALGLRDYQDGIVVPNNKDVTSVAWTYGKWSEWGTWKAEGEVNHIAPISTGNIALDNIYKFANNVNLSDARTKFAVSSIEYVIERAAPRTGDPNDKKYPDDATTGTGSTNATVNGQFVNGGTYNVYAKISMNGIRHYKYVDTADNKTKWNSTTPTATSTTVGGDKVIKSYASTGLKLMPWSTVGDGFLSYAWNEKCIRDSKSGNGGWSALWASNNELKWDEVKTTAKEIDLKNIKLGYGPKLVSLSKTPGTFGDAANKQLWIAPSDGNLGGSELSKYKVWIENESGAKSDYFTAKIVRGHAKIEIQQIRDRATSEITIYLCFEAVDEFDHRETIKLPIRVVNNYTKAYQNKDDGGSTSVAQNSSWLFDDPNTNITNKAVR